MIHYHAAALSFSNPQFITLTMNGYYSDIHQAELDISRTWHNMARILKRNASMIRYIKRVELKHYLVHGKPIYSFHLHILYDGIKKSRDYIAKKWHQVSGAKISDVSNFRYSVSIVRYLTKYICKEFEFFSTDEEEKFKSFRFFSSYNLYIPDSPDWHMSIYSYFEFIATFTCPNCQHDLEHEKYAGKPIFDDNFKQNPLSYNIIMEHRSLFWDEMMEKNPQLTNVNNRVYAILEYIDRVDIYLHDMDSDKFDFHRTVDKPKQSKGVGFI